MSPLRPEHRVGARLSVGVGWGLVLLGGCVASDLIPEPDRVEPRWAFNGEDTPVVVRGRDFVPGVDGVVRGESTRDLAFRVWLADPENPERTFPLRGVSWRDTNRLESFVPRGIPVGLWDVVVEDPRGRTGSLSRGLEVRDTRLDGLRLQADVLVQEVFQEVVLTLSAVDPFRVGVAEDLPWTMTFETLEGQIAPVRFQTEGLSGVRPTNAGLEGRLGEDGRGRVRLLGEQPGAMRITVVPDEDDDRLRGDDLILQWVRGSELEVDIQIPGPSPAVEAGQPFAVQLVLRDTFGNPAPEATVDLTLTEQCGGYRQTHTVVGRAEVEVVMQRASGRPGCAQNGLEATGAVPGVSPTIDVSPGQPAELFVISGQGQLVAGDSLAVTVSAFDAFGNVTAYRGPIASVLDGDQLPDVWSCSAPGQASSVSCSARITRAGPPRRLTVRGVDGLEGESDPYLVQPDRPAALELVGPEVWVAGEPSEVQVEASDVWGNALGPVATAQTIWLVDGDDLDCAPEAPGAWGCRAEVAAEARALTARAEVEGAPVEGQLAFSVVNSSLAVVQVVPASSLVQAGQPLSLAIRGEDAFGNPFRDRPADHGGFTLAASRGTLAPAEGLWGPDGEAVVDVVLTRAGTTEVRATSTGVVGAASVSVQSGPAQRLALYLARPWVESETPTQVRVEAEDAFGNRAALSGAGVLSSEQGGFPPQQVGLVNGLGVASVNWSAAVGLDRVRMNGPSDLLGDREVLVYRGCSAGLPTARAQVSGDAFDRSCLVQGQAPGWVDLSTSTSAPGRTLQAYAVDYGVGQAVGESPVMEMGAVEAGIYEVNALVMQDDGCARTTSGRWFVGEGPGVPAGNVGLFPAVSTVDLEGPVRQVGVDLRGVGDCEGQPVAGADVRLVATAGQLVGASVRPSGQGLVVGTDVAGNASMTLDLAGLRSPGPVRVEVASAWPIRGSSGVQVVGDLEPPVVWTHSPAGATLEPVDHVLVSFSKRIAPETLGPDVAEVTGPSPVEVVEISAVNDRSWRFDLEPPITELSEVWALSVGPAVTDLFGNPLAGTWGQAGEPWTGAWGGQDSVDPAESCRTSLAGFRPDGDPGEGEEADEVMVAANSVTTPVWWVVEVEDGDGAVVRRERVVPTGPELEWVWDGRDDAQRRVAPGVWTVAVDAEGTNGARGGRCVVAVEVRR